MLSSNPITRDAKSDLDKDIMDSSWVWARIFQSTFKLSNASRGGAKGDDDAGWMPLSPILYPHTVL